MNPDEQSRFAQNFDIVVLKSELEITKKNYEQQLNFLKNQLLNSEEDKQNLEAINQFLNQTNQSLTQRIDKLVKSLPDSQKQVQDLSLQFEQIIGKLKQELETARIKINHLEQALSYPNENLQQIQRLQREKEELVIENRKLNEKVTQFPQLQSIFPHFNHQQEQERLYNELKERSKEKEMQNLELKNQIEKYKEIFLQQNKQNLQKKGKISQSQLSNKEPNHYQQSSGIYNLYVPQDSKIQQFENNGKAQEYRQKLIEDSNHFQSYPIEDISGKIIGISLISKSI